MRAMRTDGPSSVACSGRRDARSPCTVGQRLDPHTRLHCDARNAGNAGLLDAGGNRTQTPLAQSTPLSRSPALPHDRLIRAALWSSVALNALGVAVFLPAALGQHAPLLPVVAPRFYAAQVGFVIALFCGVYAWLARQRVISRPVVVVGALGKLGFFLLFVVYWAAGDLPLGAVLQATPDLVLAIVFLWWASVTTRPAGHH